MAQQLVQLRSKKQPILSNSISSPIAAPVVIPSTWWIYQQKLKVFWLTLRHLSQSPHAMASINRFVQAFFRSAQPNHHDQQLRGECNRCGHCCRLLFNCPFLAELPDGTTNCTIYLTKHAPKVCVVFPLDPADLAEIQRAISPQTCSFYFEPNSIATVGKPSMLSLKWWRRWPAWILRHSRSNTGATTKK
jgi:hypothetical protein